MSDRADAGFPWARVMQIGLGELRLAPRDFWAMTPKELAAAAAAMSGPAALPPHRTLLDELMTRYPDKGKLDGTD